MAIKTCIGCDESAPTFASVTLNAIGWRVIVEPSASGSLSRWRCPTCWAAFKTTTGMPSLPPPRSSPPRDEASINERSRDDVIR